MANALNLQRWLRALVGSLALVGIAFHASSLVVREGEAGLVVRFGEPIRATLTPGLHWTLPWPVDRAIRLDMRRRVYEGGHTEMLTRDKRNIIARAFVVWRIEDPLLFFRAVGTLDDAESKLNGLLTNAAIGTLGGHDLAALVSTRPETLRVDAIEGELLAATAPTASHNYGITVEQIRFERISLPEENVAAVFAQMRAERRQFAERYRAEGRLEASRIRSEADLVAARLRAEGIEEATRIRGEAEAQIAEHYASSHRLDPELFRFWRSLQSLDELVSANSTLVLRTDSEPFSLLESKDPR